jgi:hypothetical protein
MTNQFKKVKEYYITGKWSKKWVYNAVGKLITAEQYKDIVGEPYIK